MEIKLVSQVGVERRACICDPKAGREERWLQMEEGLEVMGPWSVGDPGSVSWKCLGEMATPLGEVAGGMPWRLNLSHSGFESWQRI